MIGYRCKYSNVFSQVVLIGREAYPFKFLYTVDFSLLGSLFQILFFGFSRLYLLQVLNFGGFSLGVTPLPIPNREVKPQHADGTACAGVWESRSLPRFILDPDQ